MKDETTSRLEELLKTSNETFNKYESNDNVYENFLDYFNEYIAKNSLNISQVIKNSHINSNYVYKILNGKANRPGRDKIIALCVGAGMNFEEINRGLKIAREGILYVKDSRDIRIAIEANKGLLSVMELNLILENYNLKLIEI